MVGQQSYRLFESAIWEREQYYDVVEWVLDEHNLDATIFFRST